jgi:hypothetical protein
MHQVVFKLPSESVLVSLLKDNFAVTLDSFPRFPNCRRLLTLLGVSSCPQFDSAVNG